MKKTILIALSVMLTVVLLAACGSGSEGDGLGDIAVGQPGDEAGEGAAGDATGPNDVDPADGAGQTDEATLGSEFIIGLSGEDLSESEKYVLELGISVLEILKAKDWGALGSLVHPEQGLTFSPYGYVDIDNAVCLGAGDVKALESDESVRNWGILDGKGDPIELTFAEYYDRFIFDRDFTKAPQVAIDKIIRSNMENNLFVFGNGASFIEFHIPSDDPDMDMDWVSLRLVFGAYEGDLYLAAIVHDQWTI
jgi:predicted small secreted protein